MFTIHPGNALRYGYCQYIGYEELIKNYGLNPDNCIRWDDTKKYEEYIHLYPRPFGDYYKQLRFLLDQKSGLPYTPIP